MTRFNIHLTGVGGQGIGLISETVLRAADHAGWRVIGVDTHGLAQRGGIVISQVRLGDSVHSPLIPAGSADLVIALERHEAMRGLTSMLADAGTLIYYNTVWQPLDVRLNSADEVGEERISEVCRTRNIREFKVFDETLKDARMQNMALLGVVAREKLIPRVMVEHYHAAMEDLMAGKMLDANMALFETHRRG